MPGRLFEHLACGYLVPACGHQQQYGGTHRRDRTDGNTQRLQGKAADQQDRQHQPAGNEGRRVLHHATRAVQLQRVVVGRDVAAEIPQQHRQGRRHADQVDRQHHRGVAVETDAEEVGRDDVDQVRHHQRQACSVGDETCSHDKRQGRRRAEAQGQEHGHHNRREDQRCAVVGEQRRHQRPEQHDVTEQPAPAAAPPTRHMQRRPGEETGGIEQQADDDQGNEGAGGVPDDLPDHRNITPLHHTAEQCQHRAASSTPANPQAAGLPDHQSNGQEENQRRHQHDTGLENE
ncbi:hypothetical protein D3C84_491750 [compost metagenome]